MNHIASLNKIISTVLKSHDTHIVIFEGPPGWGKTTTAENALNESNIPYKMMGTYSTPLNLFNCLHANSNSVVVIDDCSGLLTDPKALAILKAATWPSRNNSRHVSWGSTCAKANAEIFEFTGKIVLICNNFPDNIDGRAIKSRAHSYPVSVSVNDATSLLRQAALNTGKYSDTETAHMVVEYLVNRLNAKTVSSISFRTLQKGYELAKDHPDCWQQLLSASIKTDKSAVEIVEELMELDIPVSEQLSLFKQQTGKGKSTYFNTKQLVTEKLTAQ